MPGCQDAQNRPKAYKHGVAAGCAARVIPHAASSPAAGRPARIATRIATRRASGRCGLW